MKRFIISMLALGGCMSLMAQDLVQIPYFSKWIGAKEIALSYDGSFTDEAAFSVRADNHKLRRGIKAPAKYAAFPISPEGAVNMTWSPDSSRIAFTRGNDLYVADVLTGEETRLSHDGSELILNGYASWVYYEEIFGRPSEYRAFWWSPDSRKIAYYRFDNSLVPMFPIYSPFGQDGSLRQTRYPKAGEPNPEVKIAMVDLSGSEPVTVWADFDSSEDQYFGTPFWSADSRSFYVPREPRLQNTLDLYCVDSQDGSKRAIYHETYKTWLDWIDDMIFCEDGFYMARCFETGWQQIYFLSYDGKTLRRITDGENWRVRLLRGNSSEVYFTANRDCTTRTTLYRADSKGNITALTDPAYNATQVNFSPDGKYFSVVLANFSTPSQSWIFETAKANASWQAIRDGKPAKTAYKLADSAGPDFRKENFLIPQYLYLTTSDGLTLPAYVIYPKNFDRTRKYPVHVDIYGGPDTPQVRESWMSPSSGKMWYPKNGIIEVVADCRAAGHNGRAGLDAIYRQLSVQETADFVEWAFYLKSLPYVDGSRMGVEGFSFGGTMTARLVMEHPEAFPYGIAGGGVYDWALYDTHYTERFMDTPQNNPKGYSIGCVKLLANLYETGYDSKGLERVMLKITHGTGDDNVHFQNTLQLIDELHKHRRKFDFMIYPDGMHGYRGYQGRHFEDANHEFWLKYLRP